MNADSLTTNWADVAKQVVDAGQSAVVEIVGAVKSIAPEVWEILIRQVYVEAITGFILPVIMLAVFAPLFRQCLKWAAQNDWDNEAIVLPIMLTGLGSLISFILALVNLKHGIGAFINPEYYAIQKFFTIASGGGL